MTRAWKRHCMGALLVLFATPCLMAEGSGAADPKNQPSPVLLDGVNVRPLMEAFQKSVILVRKPVKMYHWFSSQADSDWQKPMSPQNSLAFQYVRSASEVFWKDFGNDTEGNVFGKGLYAAVDPVASQSFGGFNWNLIELQLPAGLRLLDLIQGTRPLSSDINNLLSQFQCPTMGTLESLLKMNSSAPMACRQMIRRILTEHVPIDGFLYSYMGTYLKECAPASSPYRHSALVVTNSRWVRPEFVRFYNGKTRDDVQDRLRIQSLFYKADQDEKTALPNAGATMFRMVHFVTRLMPKNYPGSFMKGSRMAYSQNGDAKMKVTLCSTQKPEDTCQEIDLPSDTPYVSYPGPLSSSQLPVSMMNVQKLLWEDLEGVPAETKLAPWNREHLLGCGVDQVGP